MFVLTYTGLRWLMGEYIPATFVIGVYADAEAAKKAAPEGQDWKRADSDGRSWIGYRYRITEVALNTTATNDAFKEFKRIYSE